MGLRRLQRRCGACLRGYTKDMDNQRCSNLACVCEVAMLGDACADHCKNGGKSDVEAIVCHCGHAKCADEMKDELAP
ncbi:MAG: hypothetical protein NVSMB31_03070 [Vulcanimicrobiaceae bacterium]